jgi:hypothetical protein
MSSRAAAVAEHEMMDNRELRIWYVATPHSLPELFNMLAEESITNG